MQNDKATRVAIILFLAALAADMVLSVGNVSYLRILSKPLITIFLLAYFLLGTRGVSSPLRYWMQGALVLSWAGDVLLLFERYDALYFLLGLSSFLLAHIVYIIFFDRLRRADSISFKPLLVAPVAVYYAGLMALLYAHLGGLRIPVLVYGAVICTMIILALHLTALRARAAGALLTWGAALFVVSDSLLAINKFAQSFAGGSVLVMLTYGLAQFFLVRGSILVLQKTTSRPVAKREGELSNDRLTD